MAELFLTPQQIFVRAGGALGVSLLGVFFLGLIPFIGSEPSAGAGFARTPVVSVNRELKGDRLPLPSDINAAVSRVETHSSGSYGAPREVPVGCDPAFSPVSAPRLAFYFGRCTT